MRYQNQLFQQRENALLEVARQLLQSQSWDRVTIAEVAHRAGIGKGTVYKHFPSKEALYARLVLDRSREHLAALRTLYAESPPTQAMARVIRQAFAQMFADPLQAQLSLLCDRPAFQERLEPLYQRQFLELEGQYLALFSQMLRDRFHDFTGDYQYLLWGLEACINGVILRIASEGSRVGSITLNEYFDHVTNFIIASLHGQTSVPRCQTISCETVPYSAD
ncbi:TetR/AcrR family transcriptional regulator [Stutzerimonas stutzeri]|uniref:TetR/AcrR family transcriptional regulator n=1 Tax=Stutzerimonas stutzeri TaxID=316 RepID=UPI003CFFD9AA